MPGRGLRNAGGSWGQGSKWIWPATRLRIYERDGFRCIWCRSAVLTPAKAIGTDGSARIASLDHVVPRDRGGSNRAGNLLTACLTCNDRRGAMSALEFANLLPEDAAEVLERVIEAMGRELPPKAPTARRAAPRAEMSCALVTHVSG